MNSSIYIVGVSLSSLLALIFKLYPNELFLRAIIIKFNGSESKIF